MRYTVRYADRLDLTCIAATARTLLADEGVRLLQVCDLSSHIWLAADEHGVPDALFGIAPVPDDPGTGIFWMFVLGAAGEAGPDRANLLRLVLDEMFEHFLRLENVVDERKTSLLSVMRSAGFAIEPAIRRHSGQMCHTVWIELRASRSRRAS